MDSVFNKADYASNEKMYLLYRLKDGKLTPLKQVKFNTDQTCGRINVGKSSRGNIPFQPLQIWFLSEDLVKAEIVE